MESLTEEMDGEDLERPGLPEAGIQHGEEKDGDQRLSLLEKYQPVFIPTQTGILLRDHGKPSDGEDPSLPTGTEMESLTGRTISHGEVVSEEPSLKNSQQLEVPLSPEPQLEERELLEPQLLERDSSEPQLSEREL